MTVVVATRMTAKDFTALRTGMGLSNTVVKGIRSAPGYLGGRILADRHRAMWTVTVWQDPAAVSAFGLVHADVAARGPEVADDMRMTGWQQGDARIPTWRDVRA